MSKGYKINIKNLHYALVTKDDETGIEYGPITKIPGMMEITVTPNVLEGKLYGDGQVVDQESMLESLGVALNLNKLPLKNRAEMRGNTYEAGELEEGVNDKAPYLALGWEVETTTGKPELAWLYKGKMAPPTDEARQREGNITYNTNNTNFTFIPRAYDGKIRKLADGNDEGMTAEKIAAWFKKIPGTIGA